MSDQLFAGMRPVGPADDVKQHVLRAARTAAGEASAAPRRWWGFNRFDLVWVAAVLLLVMAHALLSLSGRPFGVRTGTSLAIAEEAQLEKELGVKRWPLVIAARRNGENDGAQRQLIEELERL